MSIQQGNLLASQGRIAEAIQEYSKIPIDSPLYSSAQFNIKRLSKHDKQSVHNMAEFGHPAKRHVGEPFLSIIMPVYNVSTYLDTSILSVLSQTYRNFELIIINDASTDNCESIIDFHSTQDERIIVRHLKQNTLGGAGIPSNLGIDMARGDYIGFVDSDDWIKPDAFYNLVDLALEHDADLVIGDFCTFHEDDRICTESYDHLILEELPKHQSISIKTHPSLFKLSPVPWRKLYKKHLFTERKIRFPSVDCFYEDNPLHWGSLLNSKSIVCTDSLISYHRMGREGQTISAASFKLGAFFTHFTIITNHISSKEAYLANHLCEYVHSTRWIVNRQKDESDKSIFMERLAQACNNISDKWGHTLRQSSLKRLQDYTSINRLSSTPLATVIVDLDELNADSLSKVRNIRRSAQSHINVYISARTLSDSIDYMELSSEFSDTRLRVFVTNKKDNKWRSFNTLIPLSLGRYTVFTSIEHVPELDLRLSLLLADRKSVTWLEMDAIQSSHLLIPTALLHSGSIFFGPGSSLGWFSMLSMVYLHSHNQSKSVDFMQHCISCMHDRHRHAISADEVASEIENFLLQCSVDSSIEQRNAMTLVGVFLDYCDKNLSPQDRSMVRHLENRLLAGFVCFSGQSK